MHGILVTRKIYSSLTKDEEDGGFFFSSMEILIKR